MQQTTNCVTHNLMDQVYSISADVFQRLSLMFNLHSNKISEVLKFICYFSYFTHFYHNYLD